MAPDKKYIIQKQTQVKDNSKNNLVIPALIFISCFILYGNTVYNGYACDDGIYTYKNEFILKGFSAFKDIFDKGSLYGYNKNVFAQNYRPLTLLNFMTAVSIFGLNPHVGHFFNVLFFALTVLLLYFFLQKILKNYNHAIIIAATLLFAFHPIHTEVVANIKSRDEILGFLFGLISFYFILLHEEKKETYLYLISLATFFAALFCKEDCLTYAVIIPLLLYFFTSLEIKKIALKTIPYIVLVSIYLLIRIHVLQHINFTHLIPVMNNALMAAGNNADRTATSFVLLGKYIYMTLIPYPLSWDYSYNQIPIVSWRNIKPVLSLLLCAIMVGFMLWGVRKKSIFSFLIALFFVPLSLSSNLFIEIASTFGERFLYAPSLAFCIALPVLTAKTFKLNPDSTKVKFYLPFACLLIVYAIIVIPRNAVWKNNFTLYSSGVITSPNSARAHSVLAHIYMDSAQGSKNPGSRLKFYSLAGNEFKRVTQISTNDPESYYNLGVYYYGEGYPDSAIPEYKKTLQLNPKHTLASNNLGIIYFDKKQYDSALPYFLLSYKADSNNINALINIGASCQSKKNYILAFHYDSLILKKDPGNNLAISNLSGLHDEIGVQYAGNNELDKALEEFSLALTCDSNSPDAIGNMGIIYQKKGNIEKAKLYYQKALLKDPNNETIIRNLHMLNEAGIKK